MSALPSEADIKLILVKRSASGQKRSFKFNEKHQFDRPLTATSGHSLVIAAILNAQFAYAESADMQALQRPRIDSKRVAAATPKHIR